MPIVSSKTSIDSAKDSAKDSAEDPTIELSEDLSSLLCAHGIADSYIGYDGARVDIPITHRIAILQLKGTAVVNSEGQLDDRRIRQALESLQLNQWQSVLPPVLIDWQAEPGLSGAISIPLRVPLNTLEQPFLWTLVTEQGEHWQGEFLPSQLILKSDFHQGQSDFQERWLPLAEISEAVLLPGYHVFSVKPSGENPAPDLCSSLSLIIAPSRCHEPHWAANHQRLWGFSAQLYSVRSEKNWGIGDSADLDELIRLAAANGADFLILNPLHASDAASPEQCSPYSPADRRRLNPMYLDINIEPEFDACLKADAGLFDMLEPHIAQLNQTTLVDYTPVSELKYRVFSLMFTMFLQQHKKNQTSRFQAFQHYVQRSGQALEQFTQWQATAKAPMTGTHGDCPEFYAYLQWLTENQLEQCQQLALSLGMKIGLIRDLAVGSDVNGAEVVMNPQAFCREASIGASPDPLAPQGQNWGLPL